MEIQVHYYYYHKDRWEQVPRNYGLGEDFLYHENGARYQCRFSPNSASGGYDYELEMEAPYPTQLRMELTLEGEEDYYHVIPCNIYGNNNEESAAPGEFPFLRERREGDPFAAPRWEVRADRAATPVSTLSGRRWAVGVTIEPYADGVQGGMRWNGEDGTGSEVTYIHNGLFAKLPHSFGVSLGYTNDPVTFMTKTRACAPTAERACKAKTTGSIYLVDGQGRMGVHEMIRQEYPKRHERAVYEKDYLTAIQGMVGTFTKTCWDETSQEYTNMHCHIPDQPVMTIRRVVRDIGWCGGGVLAYPLIVAEFIEGAVPAEAFLKARSGTEMIHEILNAYNPVSGLLYNYTKANAGKTNPNDGGWRCTPVGHTSYMMGSALHYILKSMMFLRSRGQNYPSFWMERSRAVLDEIIALQREDGAFGYTYSDTEKKVIDWDGFAGCWFAPAAAYMWKLGGDQKYAEAADRALDYYHRFVVRLNCYGTPLDTRKAVDEEGNLAFIRGSRLMHEYTGEEKYLQYLKDGASYEYLWRYSYKSRPECPPLNDGLWNSCGGSVTSISNPHIHPMELIVDADLRYLARVTGDNYHMSRAEDSLAWAMQNLERYPEKDGYGQYGMMSERWCPSDGLLSERYSDGSPSSTWFSYNLWAAANALEAIEEKYLER